jgi:RNA polymerase sigma factor (sigma-70 family)
MRDRSDEVLWSEFLRRYGGKIRQFVRGTLILRSVDACRYSEVLPRAFEVRDLVQNVILRLVEHDCALMRGFSGTMEREWLAYLAVITRSTVCDTLRREGRLKRSDSPMCIRGAWWEAQANNQNQHLRIERHLLAEEVRKICESVIRIQGGEHADRDILIFDLYFFHDLSTRQIAALGRLGLSKTAVGKVLRRLRRQVRRAIDQNLLRAVEGRSQHCKVVNIDDMRRERERERETRIRVEGTG